MKKIALLTVILFTFVGGGKALAQDCDAILAPFFQLNNMNKDDYPAEKAAWFCILSQNSFYLSTTAPREAHVYDLTDLTDLTTGEKVSSDFVPDLNTLSYYRYNFSHFRHMSGDRACYFRYGRRSDHTYLVLRETNEAYLTALHEYNNR
ncbi:MAG: hypothetical protein MJZ86_02725 [Bacteroidales bacterium]|nr:hypothetical protein [Bacteroidales bacterium]